MSSITYPVPNVGESILAVGPLPYLLSLAYLVLSTALLLYVIATLMDIFKADELSLELILEKASGSVCVVTSGNNCQIYN
ncbi:hypothetical protein [Spiroplasma mirum]|nr:MULTISPECIES: hypothetical protein [Spiroplasma]